MHQWMRLPLEGIISSLNILPYPLSWTSSSVLPPCRIRSIGLVFQFFTNHTTCVYCVGPCVGPSSDVPSADNFPTASVYNFLLVRGIVQPDSVTAYQVFFILVSAFLSQYRVVTSLVSSCLSLIFFFMDWKMVWSLKAKLLLNGVFVLETRKLLLNMSANMSLTVTFDWLDMIYCSNSLLESLVIFSETMIRLNWKFEAMLCWKLTATSRIILPQLLLVIISLTYPVSIFLSLIMKIKTCLLPQKVSWDGTFDLETVISVTPRLFLGYLLLEQIHLFCPIGSPL